MLKTLFNNTLGYFFKTRQIIKNKYFIKLKVIFLLTLKK